MSMINEFVEKLVDRLEELKKAESDREDYSDNHDYYGDWEYAFEDGASDGRHYAYAKAIKIIKELAEEYKDVPDTNVGKWIPCEERLPDDGAEVLLTFKNCTGIYVGEATYKNKLFYYVAETEVEYYEQVFENPIAWMHLPDPHKG